jgi:hypothetical protein
MTLLHGGTRVAFPYVISYEFCIFLFTCMIQGDAIFPIVIVFRISFIRTFISRFRQLTSTREPMVEFATPFPLATRTGTSASARTQE